MQTINPRVEAAKRRLRSKRWRKKHSAAVAQKERERLYLSRERHLSTPGFARY